MNLFHSLLVLLSAIVVVAYICRLDVLQFKRHKFKVIALHVALMASAASAGATAAMGDMSLQGVAGLLAAGAWLWVSIPSWRYGPPEHAAKALPIQPIQWPLIKEGDGI